MDSEVSARLVSFLIGLGLVIGGLVGGCLLGFGTGYLIEGEGAENVHQGFITVMLLAFIGAVIGFIVGIVYAVRIATYRRLRRESNVRESS